MIIVLGTMFGYQDAKKNDLAFQSHPEVVIATDFFCGFLAASIFYFGSGWLAKRKEKGNSGGDKFYDQVANELKDQILFPGLWTKAYAEMNGDDSKARALYIRYRVQELQNKQMEATRQQLKDARSKAKEMRRAKETAKPPLTPFLQIANVFVAIPCACISVLMTLGCLGIIMGLTGILDETASPHKRSNVDTDLMLGIPFIGGLAVGFGWIAFKCIKSVIRSNSRSQKSANIAAK